MLWLIGNRTSCRPIRSVIILVIKQIGLPLRDRPILLITRMITDRIGLHSVLLPLLITVDNNNNSNDNYNGNDNDNYNDNDGYHHHHHHHHHHNYFHTCLSLRFNRSTRCLATFAITGLTSDLPGNSTRLFVLKVRQLTVRGSLTPTSLTRENQIFWSRTRM